MSGRVYGILILVFLFNTTSVFADLHSDIVKCFQLISTGKRTYAIKATAYVKKAMKENSFSEDQQEYLKQLVELGEYFSLDALKQRKQLKEIGKKYDIIRHCFTCKGTAVLEKNKRCKDCKAKGICYYCRGDGYYYLRNGSITSCTKCVDGVCGVCKGEKFLDEDCTKCDSVTGDKLDNLKLRTVMKNLLSNYLKAPKAPMVAKKVPQVPEKQPVVPEKKPVEPAVAPVERVVKRVTEVNLDISSPQVIAGRNTYNGIFHKNIYGLFIIFYSQSMFDPLKIKCSFEGKDLNFGDLFYSAKYECYMVEIKDNVPNVHPAVIGTYVDQDTYVLNLKKDRNEFLKARSLAELQNIYSAVGEYAIQNQKVCGIFAKEKLVNRKTVSNWITNLRPYYTSESYLPFKSDFLQSFEKSSDKDLNADLLFIGQYLEWEAGFLKSLQNVFENPKDKLDVTQLQNLKKSFSAITWKTSWAKSTSQKIIDTITQLEKLK